MKDPFKTIDDYVNAFPPDVRSVLERLRRTIRKAAPGAVEAMSYQMPTFKLNGKNLVHFAAWKDHLGFYPTPTGTKAFQKELSRYKGGRVRCDFRWPSLFPSTWSKESSPSESKRIRRKTVETRRNAVTISRQKIIPNFWFDREAEEAAKYYASLFKNTKVGHIFRAGKAGYEIHGLLEGAAMTVEFELEGQKFIGINGGPLFKFNPSVSFLVACRTKDEVNALWERLAEGGVALMEQKYGWTQRRSMTSGRSSPRTAGRKACAAGSRISSASPGKSPRPAWRRCCATPTRGRSNASPTPSCK